MKVLFVNLSGLTFTVATPETEPLGGTESSLCYLARSLKKRGHEIYVVARHPDSMSDLVMGVHHVPPTFLLNGEFLAAQNFDVIIALNAPVAGPSLRAMAPNAFLVLWCHLAPDHSAIAQLAIPDTRNSYDGIVYVSNWQRVVTQDALGFTKASAIIGNGFAPCFENMFTSADELQQTKQNLAVYSTTPFRGLPVLVDAMAGLATGTHLDIYSSMKVYQSRTEDDKYAHLYTYAVQNPMISHHGAVSQKELAGRLRPASFFTYPSTYAETFCIAALEARAAGLKVLTTATAALPEVLGDVADYIPIDLDHPRVMIDNYRAMLRANAERFLRDPTGWAEERFADLQHVNRECRWEIRAEAWERLLGSRRFT